MSLAEIEDIKEALNNLEEMDGEVLVPLANGIFVKAQVQNKKEVLINVGYNTVVKKTLEDALKLVQKQEEEIIKSKVNAQKELAKNV